VKNLKFFEEFIKTNENLRDKMIPKSDKEINSALANKSKDELIKLYLKGKETYILDYLYANFNIKENPLNLDIDKILNSYLYAALWTEELESQYDIYDINFDIKNIKSDIRLFVCLAGDLLEGINEDSIGNDLWLTRHGHGSGFWDRNEIDVEIGEKLSDIANHMGDDNNTLNILYGLKPEEEEEKEGEEEDDEDK